MCYLQVTLCSTKPVAVPPLLKPRYSTTRPGGRPNASTLERVQRELQRVLRASLCAQLRLANCSAPMLAIAIERGPYNASMGHATAFGTRATWHASDEFTRRSSSNRGRGRGRGGSSGQGQGGGNPGSSSSSGASAPSAASSGSGAGSGTGTGGGAAGTGTVGTGVQQLRAGFEAALNDTRTSSTGTSTSTASLSGAGSGAAPQSAVGRLRSGVGFAVTGAPTLLTLMEIELVRYCAATGRRAEQGLQGDSGKRSCSAGGQGKGKLATGQAGQQVRCADLFRLEAEPRDCSAHTPSDRGAGAGPGLDLLVGCGLGLLGLLACLYCLYARRVCGRGLQGKYKTRGGRGLEAAMALIGGEPGPGSGGGFIKVGDLLDVSCSGAVCLAVSLSLAPGSAGPYM